MEMSKNLKVLIFSLNLLTSVLVHGNSDNERKPYIVYMGDLPEAGISVVDQHHNLLVTAVGDESIARESKIYSYGRSFNGFVARLLPHEVNRLSEEESVVSVFENTRNKLHTTRSWDYLGMTETIQRRLTIESSIVVGVLDTGIYVNAPSFRDEGYGPNPAKWKGKCATGANFTGCNKKVIGAKYYDLQNISTRDKSPADDDGHGTHTSSTVAGVAVNSASLYGIGNGTARGGVPSARIAMYKVCWEGGCTDMDLLAAFDDAIADGVDLLSVSIGGWSRDYIQDPIAIGSFHAMKHGILTSCSAGNDGPMQSSVSNVAPWIMTVGASSIDRQFKTALKLGNGLKTTGISISTFAPKKQMYPLTSGPLANNVSNSDYVNTSACDAGTLDKNKVKGKIVYCLGNGPQDYTIRDLKGAGVILSIDTFNDVAFTSVIRSTSVSIKDGLKIDHYINTTKNPQAVIYKTRTVPIAAPAIASFSARGPQLISLNILKPDLAAPGLDILAGYSRLATITGDPADKRYSAFNIISGTSMSCPHAAAAAGYVKSFHPDWSPAMIKSALMTTATPMKIKDISMELGSGSGQINPRRAIHPGLVYDISMSNYLSFLCKEGYNSTTIGSLIGGKKKYNCSDFKPARGSDGLNYPSMHLQLKTPESKISAVYYRTVTHVGYGKSVYKAIVKAPENFLVKVIPDTLRFTTKHQKLNFKVLVKGDQMANGKEIQTAWLEWNDSKHSVKSPIAIYRNL
ncbi:subtilisin-like protease SBT4.15 [Ricinus communis]|uniref:Xylem serine proteinase 1, putative n=1 Tax=Ricinus communis TaxID=3988 RepID=B9T5M7_RICCO|nr:subtilisin-like protease SBT4.15 [Ricinus communis]EEF28836.1 Xylem serine proteinase 1 precursor, putative [Ricinus communis]|eukprot:XP_002533546.1 subtilisin-like protease SBT4.15 [Ricinus communis]